MENNSLFSDTSISEVKSDLFSSNSDSLFNDPTTVDINKIREESTDINLFASSDSEKESTDIKSLLNPDGFKKEEPTGFVKNFEEKKEPEKINNNEVIGNGLLAGMPVIKPVEVEEDKKESAFSSLFDTPKEEIKDDLNDLFGGSSNQNAINNESVVSTSNVQLAVNDVKDVIKSYQEKGYTVTVEELDLDREIQLIVKFNKN